MIRINDTSTVRPGFTIVELLIVIVVIGILAAITIVSFNGVTAKADKARYVSDVKTILQKAEIFKTLSDSGVYPSAAPYGVINFVDAGDTAAALPGDMQAMYFGPGLTVTSLDYDTVKQAADGKNSDYGNHPTYVTAICSSGKGYEVLYPDPITRTNVLVTTGDCS